MDPETLLLFQNLGISLLLGMLVGLQRERSNALIAGLRTFPLIAVLGTLCAAIDNEIGGNGWIVAAGLLAVAASTLVSHSLQFRSGTSADPGMTSMVAILLMYGVGAYLVHGERSIAVAVGGGTAVLLQFKPELHGFAKRLGDKDIKAIMTFVLITCVVLPVLPNRTYDVPLPLSILNPFEIWLMVVLMVGISLGGYLIYKFVGSRIGVLLIGILGGSISSTATTASFSRRTRSRGQRGPHGRARDSNRLHGCVRTRVAGDLRGSSHAVSSTGSARCDTACRGIRCGTAPLEARPFRFP